MVGTRGLYSSARKAGEAYANAALRLGQAALLMAGLSACALSVPMGSVAEDDITTSSVTSRPRKAPTLSADLGDEDWRRAKSALAVALDPQGSGAPVSWDNPDTRMRGTFKPQGQPFVREDEICRAFTATLAARESKSTIEGTACRPSGGEWSLKEVKQKRA